MQRSECGAIRRCRATPRAEIYARLELASLAARYFGADDVTTIETGPPFAMPRQ